MNGTPETGETRNTPSPPVKKPQRGKPVDSTTKKEEPRGFKAWLIRMINRAIGRLSRFT